MNIVDSSGWLEYFAQGGNAGLFAPAIRDTSSLVVPTVCMYEVFKRMLVQRGEEDALQAIGVMSLGAIADLTQEIAINAAQISSELKIDHEVAPHLVVVAGPSGERKSPLSADMLAYGRSMMGIIRGVSLTGSVITPQHAFNTAFYRKTVSLEDILFRQVVNNYTAETLRGRIIQASEPPPFLQH